MPTFDELWREATIDPSCKVIDEPHTTRVECMEKKTTYYFTKAQHSAHPGVVRRTLLRNEDGYYVHTDGYVFDVRARENFEQWLKAFMEHDGEVRKRFSEEQEAEKPD
jgi:hypothetical protein